MHPELNWELWACMTWCAFSVNAKIAKSVKQCENKHDWRKFADFARQEKRHGGSQEEEEEKKERGNGEGGARQKGENYLWI